MKFTTKHRTGFTLIEVLVAVVIVSVGLLGAGLAVLVVSRSNSDSYLQQSATLDLGNLSEAMRANPAGVLAGNYDGTVSGTSSTTLPSCAGGSVSCSPAQVATYDTAKLARALQALPDGQVRVASTNLVDGYVTVNMQIQWSGTPQIVSSGSVPPPAALRTLSLQETL